MKKEADVALAFVQEIALATRQPESLVLAAYNEAASHLKRDARVMDYVPLFAAKRVRATFGVRASIDKEVA